MPHKDVMVYDLKDGVSLHLACDGVVHNGVAVVGQIVQEIGVDCDVYHAIFNFFEVSIDFHSIDEAFEDIVRRYQAEFVK